MAERQLAIKSSVVERLMKDISSYQKETEYNQRTLDDMKARGEDMYKVRQQENVIQESAKMVPDSEKRLGTAVSDLRDLMTQHEELADTTEYKRAEEVMGLASV